jgi:hypothetical protein
MSMTRRQFVRAGAAGALALSTASPGNADPSKLPQRILGNTGVSVPILGLGTVAFGALPNERQAAAFLHKAIDLGVTFIDTAPRRSRLEIVTGYVWAQRYLGAILKERRKEVFIATKCLETDGSRTLDILHASLKEMRIEQADLVYTHAVGHAFYEIDKLTADDGPMATLERAKKEGLTRFVGVTAHNRPEKVVKIMERRKCDVMMLAVNIVDRHTYAFENIVCPLAQKLGVGVATMKVFGGGMFGCKLPKDLCHASFRYALSVPGVALNVIGMGQIDELEKNVEWARSFKPMSKDEADELKPRTLAVAKELGLHLDIFDKAGEKSRPKFNT